MLAAIVGCAGPLADDGSSVSVGTHADGALRRGVTLPPDGDGYTIPGPWRLRDSNHGTEEVVAGLVRAARQVARRHPGAVAAIGDLSRRGGGTSAEHRSHGSGRDVDVFFYAVEESGRPHAPGVAMLKYAADGRAIRWSPADGVAAPHETVPPVRFDVRRNWAMVRALLTDPETEVQWIFVHKALSALMIDHAVATGEDPALVARAAAILHQPTDAQPHDDHMHVRFYCDVADRALGCSDRGPTRWWKKRWKYMGPPAGRVAADHRDALDTLIDMVRVDVPVGLRVPRS